MKRLFACFVILACLGLAPLHAQEAKLEEPGPPPRLGLLAKVDAERAELEIWYVTTQTTFETRMLEEVVDGQRVVKSYIVPRPVQETRALKAKLHDVAVSTAAGEKLDQEEALKRLQRGSMVFFHTGDKLDARYLRTMKDDTLILRLPLALIEPGPRGAPPPK